MLNPHEHCLFNHCDMEATKYNLACVSLTTYTAVALSIEHMLHIYILFARDTNVIFADTYTYTCPCWDTITQVGNTEHLLKEQNGRHLRFTWRRWHNSGRSLECSEWRSPVLQMCYSDHFQSFSYNQNSFCNYNCCIQHHFTAHLWLWRLYPSHLMLIAPTLSPSYRTAMKHLA